jgi:hypothetical protein
VVGHATGDERRHGDPAEVHRRAEHRHRARAHQRVVPEDLQELLVQPGGQVRAVGVPGQDVERRRVLAHQPLVHEVVEDQVVRAHPAEDRAHVAGGDDPTPARVAPGQVQQARTGERAERRPAGEVEEGDRVARAVHAVVAGGGEVVEHRGHDLTPGAEADRVDVR